MSDYDKNDWGTPDWLLARVQCFLGGIDLDPASSTWHNLRVQAERYLDGPRRGGCGLSSDWSGKVWLNPPYSGQGTAARWAAKLTCEILAGRVVESLSIWNASVCSSWGQNLLRLASCVLFPSRRVQFEHPIRGGSSNRYDQMIIYNGDRGEAFGARFSDVGVVLLST